MSEIHDREAWTAYAESRGLLRTDPRRPAPSSSTPANDLTGPGKGLAAGRRNKYGARRVQVDGFWFDSIKESARYQVLKLLRDAGAIAELELQPVFPLHLMELYRQDAPIRITTIGRFTADFRYLDLRTGEIVVEDVKEEHTKTTAYRLRKRAAEVIHGIHVREV